jgi:phosphate transport system substrate-binding protein
LGQKHVQTIYLDFSRMWSKRLADWDTIVPYPRKTRKQEPGAESPDVWRTNIMKKITRRSFLTVCGAVAAAAALTACGGSASSAAASSTSAAAGSTASSTAAALSGNVATGGSTSMKNVIAALTEGFAEVEPGVTVSYDPTGSGAGITGATDKTLDIGLSSRALKDDEKADVDGTTIALDGIAIIVNNASKVEDLTVDQLKQMFTGEITNWSEVGGDDGEIVLIGREAGSGTRDGFESIVDVKDSCKYAQELTATGAVISAVEANPLAIGYASLSAVGDTVKMVTVGGVECSEETVKDGSYEVQRPFVFVTNKSVTLSEQAQAFFDFATSADAADLIRTAGAVPVNE